MRSERVVAAAVVAVRFEVFVRSSLSDHTTSFDGNIQRKETNAAQPSSLPCFRKKRSQFRQIETDAEWNKLLADNPWSDNLRRRKTSEFLQVWRTSNARPTASTDRA